MSAAVPTPEDWAASVRRASSGPCGRIFCSRLGCGFCLKSEPIEVEQGAAFQRVYPDGDITEVEITEVNGEHVRGRERLLKGRRRPIPGWWTTVTALGLPFYRRVR